MKQEVFEQFYNKVVSKLEEYEFHYIIHHKEYDSDLSTIQFSIKEIPLVMFGIWYMCFPDQDFKPTHTPQPFLYAEFEYDIDKFKPSCTVYSPSFDLWRNSNVMTTEEDTLNRLDDLIDFVKQPWLISNDYNAKVDYLYHLGERTLNETYYKWLINHRSV